MKIFNRFLMATILSVSGIGAMLTSALVQAQEVRTYFITDAVGSPVMATDAYANVTWSEDYLPYGERRYRSVSSGANERWFTGAPQNEDTGLVDLGNRQYDPVIGRFLSTDPVGASPGKPFSINRYAYSNNNPYRYADPHGNIPVDTIWDIGSVVYDLGKVTVGWTIGNQAMVVEGLTDAAADTAAMLIPYAPAGSTKLARMGARATDEVADVGKAASRTVALEKQAAELISLNGGKNRVTLRSEGQQLEIDLAGKAHNGIPTPHTKVSPRNTHAPEDLQPKYNTSESKSTLRPATQEDIRTVRRYLEHQ